MTILNDIRQALDARLATTVGVPDLAFENAPYDAVAGTTYIRTQFITTSVRPAVRGPSPSKRYQGLYVMTICVPEAKGAGAVLDLADDLLARFAGSSDVRNNLLLQTEAFNLSPWVNANNATVSANVTVAPDGTTTADVINKLIGTAVYVRQVVSASIGATYTASVYLKKGSANSTRISLVNGTSGSTIASREIEWSNLLPTDVNLGNDWYRFSLTGVASSSQVSIRIYPSGTNNLSTSGTVNAWGAQIEEGAFASGYTRVDAEPVAATVSIEYSETQTGYMEPPFYCLPVAVAWYAYAQ